MYIYSTIYAYYLSFELFFIFVYVEIPPTRTIYRVYNKEFFIFSGVKL